MPTLPAAPAAAPPGAADFQSAFDNAPIGMAITTPTGVLLAVNAALGRLLDRSREQLVGGTLFDSTHPDDLALAGGACARLQDAPTEVTSLSLRLLRRDGRAFEATVTTSAVLGDDGSPAHLVMHVQDVSAQHEVLQALHETSTRDPLTGLANRALLMDRLHEALGRHDRPARHLSVLFVDLDGLKQVNDTHGHAIGDALLVHAACQLSSQVRPTDTVARVGGDEFVMVCDDTDERGAEGLRARVATALLAPLQVANVQLRARASIGSVTTTGPPGATPAELLRRADDAMYEVKRRRRQGAAGVPSG